MLVSHDHFHSVAPTEHKTTEQPRVGEVFGTSNGSRHEGSDSSFTSTSIAQGFATLTGVAFSADACRPRQSCPMLQCIARTQDARLTHYAGADDGCCHPHHSHDHRAGRECLCGTED